MTALRAIAAYHHRAADILSSEPIDRDQLAALRQHSEWAGFLDGLADEADRKAKWDAAIATNREANEA